jgi:hypothetical protein
VSVRYGPDTAVPLRQDIARLTPLPSGAHPAVVFMGVTAHGTQAVFALGEGVQHAGPGICRFNRADCTSILLKAGGTERLAVPAQRGATRNVILRVVRITPTLTHSLTVAQAAYARHSALGLCELLLGNPMVFNPLTGTLSNQATAACQSQATATAFAPAVSAGS